MPPSPSSKLEWWLQAWQKMGMISWHLLDSLGTLTRTEQLISRTPDSLHRLEQYSS